VGESIVQFSVSRQPANEDPLKELGNGAAEIYAAVGGWVSLGLASTLIYGIEERHLPRHGLDLCYPNAIQEEEESSLEDNPPVLHHAITDTVVAGRFLLADFVLSFHLLFSERGFEKRIRKRPREGDRRDHYIL
jgi:hypothetical protein